jgi:hypothetical protein
MTVITTKRDLRNYLDDATTNYMGRTDADLDAMTDAVQAMGHPAWGTDWTEFFSRLPADLTELLDDA